MDHPHFCAYAANPAGDTKVLNEPGRVSAKITVGTNLIPASGPGLRFSSRPNSIELRIQKAITLVSDNGVEECCRCTFA